MAVNRERSTREDQIQVDINGSLAECLMHIKDLIVQYGSQTRIECTEDSYDEHRNMYVFVQRYETDAEMAKRIVQEEKMEKMQQERDRRDYERLRAQFEGK